MNFDDGEISKISSTFDQNWIIDFLMRDEVVVSSEDEIDAFDCFCQFDVIVHHHVGERDDHVALFLLSQLLHHNSCKIDEGNVLADLFVVGVKSIDPFLLRQTEHADLEAILIENKELQALCQTPLSAFIVDVAEQPWETGSLCHVHHVF